MSGSARKLQQPGLGKRVIVKTGAAGINAFYGIPGSPNIRPSGVHTDALSNIFAGVIGKAPGVSAKGTAQPDTAMTGGSFKARIRKPTGEWWK